MPALTFAICRPPSAIRYILFAFCLCLSLSVITTSKTYAQSVKSNCVVTKIGALQGPTPTLPPQCNVTASCGAATAPVWLNSGASAFPNHPDWLTSQCSGASLAEVFNAYNVKSNDSRYQSAPFTTEQMLTIEQSLNIWNHAFLFQPSIQASMQKIADIYGLTASTRTDWPITTDSLTQIINTANKGQPVLVGAPNHWLVVTGGDTTTLQVNVLDSSGHNYKTITQDHFLHGGWDGFTSWNSTTPPPTNVPNQAGYWNGVTVTFTPLSCNAGTGNTSGSNDLIKAGEAIKTAYDTCEGGFTNAGYDTCINSSLKSSGYSDAAIQAFSNKRPSTIVGCTQCLGFVALSLALANSDQNAMPGFKSAFSVLSASSFKAGSSTYAKITTPPQPGDIGVAGQVDNGIDITGPNGHILIVNKLKGNVQFIGLESNWSPPGTPGCQAHDTFNHLKEAYTFYRKQ